jgi:hypothetical protein
MAQTCSKCSRINPPDALYCYFDGNVLGGARNGGPVDVAHQPFLSPLVFPSGRSCRNFDELAVACQEEWQAAREMLEQGFLESFLGGLGRSDLATAAREAAHFPDHDRGLDQLLAKLPSRVVEAPKLRAEPLEISLGTLQVGQDRTFNLHLENQGMRLLYGSVTSDDCPWLLLGDSPGAPQKLFQFCGEMTVPVRVSGKHLRAGVKPQEGRLAIESNGGTAAVAVRVEVPIKPYPDGPLAGATTPREVAQKAKAAVDRSRGGNKKEALEVAAYFEKGKVAAWYQSNGWTYPVQGPPASGLGAVQQFFEALGLTPPPKVRISAQTVALQGAVGDRLKSTLEVSSPEKRPVYAHGVSDQPWLEVGRARLNGRTAVVPLLVPAVPNRPGELLTAEVAVTANGKQKFKVPVTLAVGESFNFFDTPAAPASEPPKPEPAPAAVAAPAAVPAAKPTAPAKPAAPRAPRTAFPFIHAVPAALLALALLAVLGWDLFGPRGGSAFVAANTTDDVPYTDLIDATPRLAVEFHRPNERFGIAMTDQPDPENPTKHKRLTYEEDGSTNNTCLLLDGAEVLFGQKPGFWVKGMQLIRAKNRYRWTSAMEYAEKVRVTQIVELVPGQSRLLDTVLIHYVLENRSGSARTVGLRIMLDTFIGSNDGVPFRIPGQGQFVETMKDFTQAEIPDYIQAWERPDPRDPGTIAHLGLKGVELPKLEVEPIEKVRICHWPGNPDIRWQWEPTPLNQPPDKKDSCVVLYWAERGMNPGERRDLAFTYGLNALSSSQSGNADLSLTAGGSFRRGREFTVTATVKNPQPGQKITLQVPRGLALVTGQDAEQQLAGGGEYQQASWRLRSKAVGKFPIVVTTGPLREAYEVHVTTRSIFE